MENLFVLIIAIGAAIFIALPFFKKRFEEVYKETDTSNPLEEKLRRLNFEKESLYSALKELDFDYSMGKLSKEDYNELEGKYKAQAVSVLREIDNILGKTDIASLDEEIEKEVRAIRELKLTDDEIEKEILKSRKSRVLETSSLICSVCGNGYRSDDRFCSKCGASLSIHEKIR